MSRQRPTGRQYLGKLDGAQGSSADRLSLQRTPYRPSTVDTQVIGGQTGDTGCRRPASVRERVRTTLEKNDLKPWRQKHWVIPPQANAAFVCAMEDVLEVYHTPL